MPAIKETIVNRTTAANEKMGLTKNIRSVEKDISSIFSQGKPTSDFMKSKNTVLHGDFVTDIIEKIIRNNSSFLDYNTTYPVLVYKHYDKIDLENVLGNKNWYLCAYNILFSFENKIYCYIVQFNIQNFVTNYKEEVLNGYPPHKVDYLFTTVLVDTEKDHNPETESILSYTSGEILEDILGDLDWDLDNTLERIIANSQEVLSEEQTIVSEFISNAMSAVGYTTHGDTISNKSFKKFMTAMFMYHFIGKILQEIKSYNYWLLHNNIEQVVRDWYSKSPWKSETIYNIGDYCMYLKYIKHSDAIL